MATLLQLETFIAVVEQGGFTAASRRLGLSQPAVSRAVASLEKELGLPLLLRRRDGLVLTEAGGVALTHARAAVRHLTLMRSEIAGLAGDLAGTLSIASLPSTTATLVAPQLQAFVRRHPAVTIRLLEGSEDEILDWLDHGAADAGVVSLPVSGMTHAVLGEQDMVAVVPADHRLAGWAEVEYAEVAKEPFIRGTGGCADVYAPVAAACGVEFDVAFEAREMMSVLEIVRAGLGVSILPSSGLPQMRDGVATIPLVPRTVRRLGIAVSASASPVARAFLDQIAARDLS